MDGGNGVSGGDKGMVEEDEEEAESFLDPAFCSAGGGLI